MINKILLYFITSIALAACNSLNQVANLDGIRQVNSSNSSNFKEGQVDPSKLASEGIKYLKQGDYDRARKLFNAAVKFDGTKGNYHLLLGATYHLEFLQNGSIEAWEKSEVGYQVASRFESRNPLPLIQLAWLNFDAKKYNMASEYFSKAIVNQPANTEALNGISITSYLSGDLITALWAADELEKLNWNPQEVVRMKAIYFAVLGQDEQSSLYRKRFSEIEHIPPATLRTLDNIILEIREKLNGQKWLTSNTSYEDKKTSINNNNLASAKIVASNEKVNTATPPTFNSLPSSPFSPFSNSLNQSPTQMVPAMPAMPAMPAIVGGQNLIPIDNQKINDESQVMPPVGSSRKAWFDCKRNENPAMSIGGITGGFGSSFTGGFSGNSGFGGSGGFGGGSGFGGMGFGSNSTGQIGGEETSNLSALPTPCYGEPLPKMVMIDAVLLRTEDAVSSSYGLNLLNGLNVFFGNSFINTKSDVSGTSTGSTRTITRGLGSSTSASLSYSLNIANAATNRNEVLARPTLLGIDRLPSTFFSGQTATISIPGTAGGTGTVADKPIGVSLSVTPTFIDEETLMLSVKAVRSFVEPNVSSSSQVILSTSRNSVNANLIAKFGDTIILSGLTEREIVRGDSGVPVLKDIPGIQYMFQNYVSTDFFRTVMIMISLRKPVLGDEQIQGIALEKETREKTGQPQRKKYAFYWRIADYEKFLSLAAPNLDHALETLETNNLYQSFKSRDLTDTNWAAKPKLDRFLNQLGDLIYR
jgi:tetratricopeptide (TPR) repeat protein